MDNRSAHDAIRPQRGGFLLVWLSALLAPEEREAVVGDLIESGESRTRAIASLLGLVLRRHTAIVLDIRFWPAVLLVALPISLLLCMTAQMTAGAGAVDAWMYLNNWDWAITRTPGFWPVLGETAMQFGMASILLVSCSWSGGFLFGRFPNSIGASRNAFVALLAVVQISDASSRILRLERYFRGLPLPPSGPDPNAPITANGFYHVFFPWIILATLVVWPAIMGIRQGKQSLFLGRKVRALLATGAAVSLLILLLEAPGFGLLLNGNVREWLWHNRSATNVLSCLACWPICYLVASGLSRDRALSL